MPYVQCKHCLERQKGRCLQGKTNFKGCWCAATAIDFMQPAELREDPLPSWQAGYRKAWWE